jgi:nitroreductase
MSARPELLEAIRLATLAPSGHNSQPWTFTMLEDGVAVFPDLTRRLPVADPEDRELYVSLGCALENLVIGARHGGLAPRVEYFPAAHASALMVHFNPGSGTPGADAALVKAIPERQTTRRPYDARPIVGEHLAALDRAAREEGVTVHLGSARPQVEAMAEMVEAAVRSQFRDSAFRAELAAWVRFNPREIALHGDGLTYRAMGRARAPRWLGSALLKRITSANREARRAARLMRSASAIMVFAAREDDREHWVRVGRSLERVALTATSLGLRYAHESTPCEVAPIRSRLQAYLGLGLAEPVTLIRLGYARARARSPRRPLDDMVLRRPVAPSPPPQAPR